MLGSFLTAIDWFGTAVFAVTGALVASRMIPKSGYRFSEKIMLQQAPPPRLTRP
jgi:hypothetical protein